jgi:hypothetical protein
MVCGLSLRIGAARVAPEKLDRTSLPRLPSAVLHGEGQMSDDQDDLEDVRNPSSPLNALVVSLVTLSDNLGKAFDTDPERKDVESERARYIHALRAISDFLRTNNAPLRYAQRWNRLAVALNDANYGIADKLLAPSSFGSLNAGDPTVEWTARAQAALGMAALIAGGATRPQAAQIAQRKIGGHIEAKTYLSWWDQFIAPAERSKTKNSLARALFDGGRSLIDPEISSSAATKLADTFFERAAIQLRKQA